MAKLLETGLGIAIAIVALVACTSTSAVKRIGGGRYSVSGTASTGWVGADDAYDAALAEAQQYCGEMAKWMVIDSTSGTATGGGEQQTPVNNQRIVFRCVDSGSRGRSRARRRAKRVDSGSKSNSSVAPEAKPISLGKAEIGQSSLNKRYDSDRDSTIYSFSYHVAPTLKLVISVAITADRQVGKSVTIELVSVFHGKPLLAKTSELVVTSKAQAAATIAVSWRKEKVTGGYIEHLVGTVSASDFTQLVNTHDSFELTGEGVKIAFSLTALSQLSFFASFIAEEQGNPCAISSPVWDD